MTKMRSIPSFLLAGLFLLSLGCSNNKEVAAQNEDLGINNPTNKIKKLPDLSTVDFYALADDSSWLFTVQYGREITFTDLNNNIKFHSKSNHKEIAGGANIVSINSENNDFILSANIGLEDCHKTGTIINLVIKRKKDNQVLDYAGCGVYRGSPRLHDIWVLESINGDTLSASQFPRELPHFEFNLNTQKMSGFAGCNQVSGNISFKYNKIIIESLLSTRMYCKETSPMEDEILKILRSQPIYNFYKLHLYIETTEGSLILKKVD